MTKTTKRKRANSHAEVLSGATFKSAASENAAKASARMHTINGHRVKVGQSAGKWGCWVWPKANPKLRTLKRSLKVKYGKVAGRDIASAVKLHAKLTKRNPASGAVAMREKFTGLPADSTVIVSRTEHVHEHLAALGDLIELRGKTIKGQPFVIEFKQSKNPRRKSKDIISKVGSKTKGWLGRRAKAFAGMTKGFTDTWINGKKRNPNGPTILASNEAGTHLFIEGGDQSLDLSKVGLGDQVKKEVAIVGPVHYITYHSRKKFDGKEEEHDYEHEFSEESGGPRPQLRYDVKNKAMFLDGGVYYVPKPFFGTSPGITD